MHECVRNQKTSYLRRKEKRAKEQMNGEKWNDLKHAMNFLLLKSCVADDIKLNGSTRLSA